MSEREGQASEGSGRGLPLGIALIAVGLIVVVAGLFLPRAVAEDRNYELFDNTLIGGPAVLFGIGIVAIVVLAWRWWAHGDVSWIALFVFALVGVVYSLGLVWLVAADLVWTDIAEREIETRPGAGSWAVLVGSLVVTGGALLLRAAEPEHRARVRKPSPYPPGAVPQQPWTAPGPAAPQPWGTPAGPLQQQPWGGSAATSQPQQPTRLPPPGWYSDPAPRPVAAQELRWWDGRQWTDARRLAAAAAQPGAPSQSAAPPRPVAPTLPPTGLPAQQGPQSPAGPESPGSLWSGPRDSYR